MSDPSLPGTPGTGPLPEPEPEGFREEQIEAERTRQLEEREEQAQLNKEATEKYSGKDLPDAAPSRKPTETKGTGPTSHGSTGTKKS
jgi:hypothetical protein